MVTPKQLRDWADALNAINELPSERMEEILSEMYRIASELESPPYIDPRLPSVPMLPAGLYGYPPVPRFLSAERWPVEGYKGRWYLMGPAMDLQGAKTVDVRQRDGSTVTVTPLEPVGWRMVQKKGYGDVLYLLMTFERAVYEEDNNPLGAEPTPR